MEKLGTDYGGWYVPTNLNLDEKNPEFHEYVQKYPNSLRIAENLQNFAKIP